MGIEPTNVGTTIRCVNHFATTAMLFDRGSRNRTHTEGFGDLCSTFKLYPFKKERWLRTESNRRHKDFQSFALPTELLSHCIAIQLCIDGGPDRDRTGDLLRDRQAC
jgi:hypothetical protein